MAALFLLVRLGASFLPEWRLWGFNQAAFIHYMPLIYLVMIIGVAFILIKGKKSATPPPNSEIELMNTKGAGIVLVYIIIPIFCGLCFYLLRVKSHFLGDGLNIIANPEMSIKYRELGEVIIHRWFVRTFGTISSDSVLIAYQTLSITSGILFVAALAYYGRRIAATKFEYVIMILLVLCTAGSVLYFGYVENYSVTAAFIGITVLAGTASLKSGKKTVIPIISFALAVLLHSISLVYLPAVLFYVALTYGGGKIRQWTIRRSNAFLAIMLVMLILGYAVVRIWAPLFWRMAFLSPLGDRFTIDGYFLLSPRHLIDYLNLMSFLIPITVVVWILCLMMRGVSAGQEKKPEHLFLKSAAFFGLVATFILEPKLGMARDWDMMSIVMAGAAFYGIYRWITTFHGQLHFKPASMIIMIISLAVFIPWLTLNNTTDALANYSIKVMKLDPRHSRSGLMTMNAYMEKRGNQTEAQYLANWCDLKYPEIELNDRGANYYRRGDYLRAEAILNQAINLNPSWFGLYLNLGMCQLRLRKFADALENLKIADGLNPYNATIQYYLGEAYMSIGDTTRAISYWHESIKGDIIVPEAYLSMGSYHLMNRRPDSALYYFSQVSDSRISIDLYYWKGLAAYMLHDTLAALKNFDEYLGLGGDSAKINNINKLRTLILGGKAADEK